MVILQEYCISLCTFLTANLKPKKSCIGILCSRLLQDHVSKSCLGIRFFSFKVFIQIYMGYHCKSFIYMTQGKEFTARSVTRSRNIHVFLIQMRGRATEHNCGFVENMDMMSYVEVDEMSNEML